MPLVFNLVIVDPTANNSPFVSNWSNIEAARKHLLEDICECFLEGKLGNDPLVIEYNMDSFERNGFSWKIECGPLLDN